MVSTKNNKTKKSTSTIEFENNSEQQDNDFKTSKISFGNLKIKIKTEKNTVNDDINTPLFKKRAYNFLNTPQPPLKNNESGNVFKKKEQSIQNNDDNDQQHVIVHDEDVDKENNITCWWCKTRKADLFKKRFLPIKYDEKRQRYAYIGFFCSWSCVKAFNFDDERNSTRMERTIYINKICKTLYGQRLVIIPTKHWRRLKKFGGNLTIEQLHSDTRV